MTTERPEQPGPDLDPHWGTLPHVEVLAVLPEGEAATVAQMVARPCPPSAPGVSIQMDALRGISGHMGTGGKLKNALREMVHAGTLCQFPPGRDLDGAAFWRPGDLAGMAAAAAHALERERAGVEALGQRIESALALAKEVWAAYGTRRLTADRAIRRATTALAHAVNAISPAIATLEKFQ